MTKKAGARTRVVGRYARMFAGRRWSVKLDADLVTLLSGSGSPAEHLEHFSRQRRSHASKFVNVLLLNDREMSVLKPLLHRLGAQIELLPPHPNTSLSASPSNNRKAG